MEDKEGFYQGLAIKPFSDFLSRENREDDLGFVNWQGTRYWCAGDSLEDGTEIIVLYQNGRREHVFYANYNTKKNEQNQ